MLFHQPPVRSHHWTTALSQVLCRIFHHSRELPMIVFCLLDTKSSCNRQTKIGLIRAISVSFFFIFYRWLWLTVWDTVVMFVSALLCAWPWTLVLSSISLPLHFATSDAGFCQRLLSPYDHVIMLECRLTHTPTETRRHTRAEKERKQCRHYDSSAAVVDTPEWRPGLIMVAIA